MSAPSSLPSGFHRLSSHLLSIDRGFVPNMRVPAYFYVNRELEELCMEELRHSASTHGFGGFLPAVQQLANVAALPGIVRGSFGMPDIHSGYGFAIGNVAAFDMDDPTAVVAPGGIGFDINCIAAGTLVSTSTGVSVPIERLASPSRPSMIELLGWERMVENFSRGDPEMDLDAEQEARSDAENRAASEIARFLTPRRLAGLECGKDWAGGVSSGLLNQAWSSGTKNCLRIRLEDTRAIDCTPDHRLLVYHARTGWRQWIKAGELRPNDVVITSVEFPEDRRSYNPDGTPIPDTDLELELGHLVFDFATEQRREQLLAFARILGYLNGDGSIKWNKNQLEAYLVVGHPMDCDSILADIERINEPTMWSPPRAVLETDDTFGAGTWRIYLPKLLTETIGSIAGQMIGDRADFPDHTLPEFLLDPQCPVSVVREFLGGIFGADGDCPFIHAIGTGLGQKGDYWYLKQQVLFGLSCLNQPKHISGLRAKLQSIIELMVRCGMPRDTLKLSKPHCFAGGANVLISILQTHLGSTDFLRLIGFRHCVHKQFRQSAAQAFWRLQEEFVYQRGQLAALYNQIHPEVQRSGESSHKQVAAARAKAELKRQHGWLLPEIAKMDQGVVALMATSEKPEAGSDMPGVIQFFERIGALPYYFVGKLKNLDRCEVCRAWHNAEENPLIRCRGCISVVHRDCLVWVGKHRSEPDQFPCFRDIFHCSNCRHSITGRILSFLTGFKKASDQQLAQPSLIPNLIPLHRTPVSSLHAEANLWLILHQLGRRVNPANASGCRSIFREHFSRNRPFGPDRWNKRRMPMPSGPLGSSNVSAGQELLEGSESPFRASRPAEISRGERLRRERAELAEQWKEISEAGGSEEKEWSAWLECERGFIHAETEHFAEFDMQSSARCNCPACDPAIHRLGGGNIEEKDEKAEGGEDEGKEGKEDEEAAAPASRKGTKKIYGVPLHRKSYPPLFLRVLSIEPIEQPLQCFDLQVRRTQSFLANGILTHNCGVRLIKTNLFESDVRPVQESLAQSLFDHIPVGVGSKGVIPTRSQDLNEVLEMGMDWSVREGYAWSEDKDKCEESGRMLNANPNKVSARAKKRGLPQLATLGAGNHYAEIQVVEEIYDRYGAHQCGIEGLGQIVVMVHCGSRGLGHQVATDALVEMESAMSRDKIHVNDKQLACARIQSAEGQNYLDSMAAAANFAWVNRSAMTFLVRQAFAKVFQATPDDLEMDLIYDVSHNIAKVEEHMVDGRLKRLLVHRKGSTRAFGPNHPLIPADYQLTGQPVLIGGSMGTSSYLLMGTEGAMESTFGSTCHGAGRSLSRNKSRRNLTYDQVLSQLEQQNISIRVASPKLVMEEAPESYKDVCQVVETCHQAGISKKCVKLKPIAVIKG